MYTILYLLCRITMKKKEKKEMSSNIFDFFKMNLIAAWQR